MEVGLNSLQEPTGSLLRSQRKTGLSLHDGQTLVNDLTLLISAEEVEDLASPQDIVDILQETL